MGSGDNLMASGMARGAKARGKRIAFGDGQTIRWDHNSEEIFRNNPNIAHPGSEGESDLEWIPYYRGHRIYNEHVGRNWVWNYNFRPTPGEMFFTDDELAFAHTHGQGFIVIEPNVPSFKSVATNKQWPVERYTRLANRLSKAGFDVRQFIYPGARHRLQAGKPIKTPTFRHALAVLSVAALYIGAEGGLHHGAAAVGIPAVVLFGGFIPPQVTGYATHTNLTGGAEACGSLRPCRHCQLAMRAIGVEDVQRAALDYLTPRQAA